jgi:hypothetical protein
VVIVDSGSPVFAKPTTLCLLLANGPMHDGPATSIQIFPGQPMLPGRV